MGAVLNQDDYVKIVKKYLQNSSDVEVLSTEWSGLSGNIEGFMGVHSHLSINYKSGNQSGWARFFVKTKPTQTEVQIRVANQINVYEKETFLYAHLCGEYQKYQIRNDFSPKGYYSKNMETIVMEDLWSEGYRLRERKDFYDLETCKWALKALAGFHGSLMVYEEVKSRELGRTYRVVEEFPRVFAEGLYEGGIGFDFVEAIRDALVGLSELMPESKEWKASFRERLKKFDTGSVFNSNIPGRKSCGHGDLWCNNMLFNRELQTCRLIDYQVLRYYHPGFDVLLLIYLNTLREFRCEHLWNLIAYYYEQFSELLNAQGVRPEDVLSKEDFLESCRLLQGLAVFQAIGGRTLTHLPLEITNETMESKQVDLQDIWFGNRAKYVLQGCERDETYKKILLNDVYDLDQLI